MDFGFFCFRYNQQCKVFFLFNGVKTRKLRTSFLEKEIFVAKEQGVDFWFCSSFRTMKAFVFVKKDKLVENRCFFLISCEQSYFFSARFCEQNTIVVTFPKHSPFFSFYTFTSSFVHVVFVIFLSYHHQETQKHWSVIKLL